MSLPDKPFQWIANYTQVPNEFFEIAPYLTEPELRIMLYAIRHTIGWKSRQESRSAIISVSSFARGYTSNGAQYEGTRLTEVTIRKALPELVRIGLLEKIGEVTPEGQGWRLPEGCNTAALAKRANLRYEQDQKRTINGRKKAEEKRAAEKGGYPITQEKPGDGGLSHNSGGGYPITQGGSDGEGYPITPNKDIYTDKEKESPASLLPIDEKPIVPADSPIGDSLSGDELEKQGEALLSTAFNADAVQGYCLRCKQSVVMVSPIAISTRSGQPATQGDCPICKGQVFRMGKTALHGDDNPASKGPLNSLIEAVGYAFNESPGSYAGKIGQFLLGTLKKTGKKSDEWFDAKPNLSPVPEYIPLQVIAFTLWYGNHEKFKSSFAEQGYIMPTTPSILRDRWDSYQARCIEKPEVPAYWEARAAPILERLMAGERIKAKDTFLGSIAPSSASAPKPAETRTYDASADDTFIDRSNDGRTESAAALLGVS